jgi:hypothetical protein
MNNNNSTHNNPTQLQRRRQRQRDYTDGSHPTDDEEEVRSERHIPQLHLNETPTPRSEKWENIRTKWNKMPMWFLVLLIANWLEARGQLASANNNITFYIGV